MQSAITKGINILSLYQFIKQLPTKRQYKLAKLQNNSLSKVFIIISNTHQMDTAFQSLQNIQQPKVIEQHLTTKEEQTKCISRTPIISDKNSSMSSFHNQMKSTFFKFSRIHYHYKLKFSTLFHAISLFGKCLDVLQNKKQSFSKEYLQLVCLYLSMKFQQIYPLKLKNFHIYFKNCSIDPSVYPSYQKKIVQLLNGNLRVKSGKEIIDEYLTNQSKEKYFFAYYLLESSLLDHLIIQRYQIQEICQAIILIMSQNNKQASKILMLSELKLQTLTKCARAIATAKSRLKIHEIQLIQRKYSKEAYQCVAGRHIILESE